MKKVENIGYSQTYRFLQYRHSVLRAWTVLFFVLLFVESLPAQQTVPNKVSYQGMVLKMSNNKPLASQSVALRLTVMQGERADSLVYGEIHRVMTNPNGLFSVFLGTGESFTTGKFGAIDWGKGPFSLRCDIDSASRNDYAVLASNQLVSVPYAFYTNVSAFLYGLSDTLAHLRAVYYDSIDRLYADMLDSIDSIKSVYDSVVAHLYSLIDSAQSVLNDTAPQGGLKGLFTVSPTTVVYFSKGNLQYQASTNTYRFADEQYDAFESYGNSADSWTDLFGEEYNRWQGTVSNGGDSAGLWRCLSSDEMNYLLNYRQASQRYAKATVNGVAGLVIFPNDCPDMSSSFNSINISIISYLTNIITAEKWDTFERMGCVFLPAASYRSGSLVYESGVYGYYWTSSRGDDMSAHCLFFSPSEVSAVNRGIADSDFPVRLVHERKSVKFLNQ